MGRDFPSGPVVKIVNDILWIDINKVEEKLNFDDIKVLWKNVLEVIR